MSFQGWVLDEVHEIRHSEFDVSNENRSILLTMKNNGYIFKMCICTFNSGDCLIFLLIYYKELKIYNK